jgi:hypothetical protein
MIEGLLACCAISPSRGCIPRTLTTFWAWCWRTIQLPDDQARITAVAKLCGRCFLFLRPKMTSQFCARCKENIHVACDRRVRLSGGFGYLEDLVEEIVGEIRDEHELSQDIVRGRRSYVMQGTGSAGCKTCLTAPDWRDTATIGGLVSAIAAASQPGEVIEDEGLRFEI